MLPRLTARERILQAARVTWPGSGSLDDAVARVVDAAAVEALRIAREGGWLQHLPGCEALLHYDHLRMIAIDPCTCGRDDLLTVLVGGSHVVEKTDDHSAGLIHQVAAELAETEPRLSSAQLRRELAEWLSSAVAPFLYDRSQFYDEFWTRVDRLIAVQTGSGNQATGQHSEERTGAQRHDQTLTFAPPEAPREEKDQDVCTDGYCSTCGAIALTGADYCDIHEPKLFIEEKRK